MIKFNKILFVVGSYSDTPSPALQHAVNLVKLHNAELTLFKVIPDYSQFFTSNTDGAHIQKRHLAQEKSILEHMSKNITQRSMIKVNVSIGKGYIETIHQVNINEYDLVIKEADNLDWLDRLIGSDDMHLLRKCPCPVWLVQPGGNSECKNILAAVSLENINDDVKDDLNGNILDYASTLAIIYGAKLHVVNTYDIPDIGFISLWTSDPEKVEKDMIASESILRIVRMQELLDQYASKVGNEFFDKLSIQQHVFKGIPDQKIPDIAVNLNADLVVMGTVSRVGIAGVIIGNTAESVLSQISTSVLTIKPVGFKSPL